MFISQSEKPVSTFNNPPLYPQMFPHLFPYGLGGIGNALHSGSLSSAAHKHWLLMYYDKRFQEDAGFIIVAFNHQLIKQGTRGAS